MIDIEDESYYELKRNHERTRSRLIRIAETGAEDVEIGHFGVRCVVSGLYIEKVWQYDDEQFDDYMNWFSERIQTARTVQVAQPEKIKLKATIDAKAKRLHSLKCNRDGFRLGQGPIAQKEAQRRRRELKQLRRELERSSNPS